MNILRIENLKYKAEEDDIIKGISFNVKKGDIISIVGSSGSGKSTLLKLLSDLIPITSGNIIYNEKSYKEYNPIDLRRKISYCIQLPYLFGETVWDNLIFPFKIRKEEINKIKIVEFLEKFNLDESYLNKNINSLSGGEKQRISIIRNLIYTPDILLLDEATSALDKKNAEVIEGYIKELNKSGVTVLWITHSIDQSAGIFNKRIVIEDGIIKEMEVLI